MVEQRTENPCVPSSILGGTTSKPQWKRFLCGFVVLYSPAGKRGELLTGLIFRRRLLGFSGVPNVEGFCLNSKIPDIFHPASITPGSTCLHLVFSPSRSLPSFTSSHQFPATPAADLGTHYRAVGGTSLKADSLPPIILSCNPQ